MAPHAPRFSASALRGFLVSEVAGGLVLVASAALGLAVANSAALPFYRATLHATVGGLSVEAWINDALMAVFFLLIGLEIKREMLQGQLRGWPARALPGLAALGGMAVPAAVYAALNAGQPSLRGWAIPAATDIAFALGVVALLGRRVPASLKVFLTALAVLDDLGAIVVIALFYAGDLSWPMLGGAALAMAALAGLNRGGVRRLAPYLALGVILWACVLRSGIHASIAGVLLAAAIPATARAGAAGAAPLHRLEHALGPGVAFLVLPLFAFANAGVPFDASQGLAALATPVTLGVGLGLLIGKQAGVFGAVWLAARLGIARRPPGASWRQVYGVALLCGIGFTMSLFIGLLAFAEAPARQDEVKIGVLLGSLASACAGALVLLAGGRPVAPSLRPIEASARGGLA